MKTHPEMKPEEKVIHYIRKGLREQHGESYDKMTEDEQTALLIQVIKDHTEQMRRECRLRPHS